MARAVGAGPARDGSAGEILEPAQRALDLPGREARVLELLLQRVAVGLVALVQLAVEIVLEQVDEDVENAFLHSLFPGSRRQKSPPGCCATRPSSSRMSSIEATAPASNPVRATRVSTAGRLEAERI